VAPYSSPVSPGIQKKVTMNPIRTLIVGGCFMYTLLLTPAVAHAQYGAKPFSDPATGEEYHVEAALEFWSPGPNLTVASESLGLSGTRIDAVADLGLTKKMLREMRFVLRPAKKHKFKLNYLPMTYNAEAIVRRDFIFNGQRFGVNLPVTTDFQWTTWLIGYEYDFLYKENWFVGFTLNSKFTNTQVNLKSPLAEEFALAQAPIPTIGGVARVYVVPNVAITADINGINIPDSVSTEYRAHYFDFDLYGTVNFNRYVGAQVGYRNIDIGYKFKLDEGTFKMKGLYFGGVVRY
jgi:hypothetical protein